MNCIRCKTTMRKVAKDDVLVDRCPGCGGIWLDSGELEMLEKGAGYEKAELMKQARSELIRDSERLVSVVGLCPGCERTKLHPVKRRGVEIDVCGHCGGIYFDEGELDQLVEGGKKTFFSALLDMVRT